MKAFACAIVLLLANLTAACAQGGVKQSGVVTTGHVAVWQGNGSIRDGGTGGGGIGSALSFGTHFSGGPYNGSAPITITIDGTSAATPGTIVARDGSGNFGGHASLDLLLAGGVLTGELTTAASTLSNAGINIPPGSVPTSPADGDLWVTPSGFFGQVNGSTVGPFSTGGGGGGNVSNSGTPAPNQLAQWVSTTAIRGLNLNAGVGAAFANALNNSGGLLAYSLIGTSGATIPLLNGFNTWSGNNTFSGTLTGTLTGHASLDLRLTGGTLTGELITPASTTGTAGFNLPQGAAPTSPVNGDLWTTSSGVSARIAGATTTLLATTGSASGLTGLLPKSSGGTGTATPALVPGTNVTITGTWPNQTINATGGGGGSVSITAGTPDLVVSPDPITGTGTISTQTLLNTQSGSSYAILTGDLAKVVEMTNAAATTMTISAAGGAGFGADWGTTILPTLARTTITPASGTICNLPSITIAAQTPLSIASDNAGNYVCAVGVPPSGTWVTSQRVVYQTPTIATATFTPAVNSGNNIRIGLTSACPCTLANFSGTLVAGQQGYIEVAQDGTGSRTIGTWGSAYVTVGGTASITLSTAASTVDYLPYAVDSTATKIVLGAIITGPTH